MQKALRSRIAMQRARSLRIRLFIRSAAIYRRLLLQSTIVGGTKRETGFDSWAFIAFWIGHRRQRILSTANVLRVSLPSDIAKCRV